MRTCAHGPSLLEFATDISREPGTKSVGQVPSPKPFSWFFLLVPSEFWCYRCGQVLAVLDGSWGHQRPKALGLGLQALVCSRARGRRDLLCQSYARGGIWLSKKPESICTRFAMSITLR